MMIYNINIYGNEWLKNEKMIGQLITILMKLKVCGLHQRSKYLQTVTNYSLPLCDEFGIKESVIEKDECAFNCV